VVVRLRYIVAATPRSGSSLLCEGLSTTDVAGRPDEVFAPDFRHLWRGRWGLGPNTSFVEYFRWAIRHGTTSNGIYALKIQWMHVEMLARDVAFLGEPAGVLDALFPEARFVNIVRRDRRAQALSWYRAHRTNEWWRFKDVLPRRSIADPTLDQHMVRSLETSIERQQGAWEQFFEQHGITPLTVVYEDLDDDYRGEVARVLSFLGLDPSPARSLPSPRLLRQGDELNVHWRRQMEAAASG
jgi:LPS sulfotransferase NodH